MWKMEGEGEMNRDKRCKTCAFNTVESSPGLVKYICSNLKPIAFSKAGECSGWKEGNIMEDIEPDYIVIQYADVLHRFQEEVNKAIANGYWPYEGLQVVVQRGSIIYAQAMMREY
jgi:hypothetical protein